MLALKDYKSGVDELLPVVESWLVTLVYATVDVVFMCNFPIAVGARYVVPTFSYVDVATVGLASEPYSLPLFDYIVSDTICIRMEAIYFVKVVYVVVYVSGSIPYSFQAFV